MNLAAAMLIALLIDTAFGWPDGLRRRIGHPRTWIAALPLRLSGPLFVLLLLVVIGLALGIARILPAGWIGVCLTGVVAWPFVTARAVHEGVAETGEGLAPGDLESARTSLETLAGDASESCIAPLFWGAVFGLPGIAIYSVINTCARHAGASNAVVKMNGLMSLIPGWLTGALIALAATGVRRTAFRTMQRDARRSGLLGAAWPIAAMAGALGVRLSGARRSLPDMETDHWMNPVADDPRPQDIPRGLVLYQRAIAFFGLLLLLAAVT